MTAKFTRPDNTHRTRGQAHPAGGWNRVVAFSLPLLLLGPYLPGGRGLRVEQVVCYGLALVVLPRAIAKGWRGSPLASRFLLVWAAFSVVSLAVLLVPSSTDVARTSAFAAADSLLVPLLLGTSVSAMLAGLHQDGRLAFLKAAAYGTALATALSGPLALLQAVSGAPWLGTLFWSSDFRATETAVGLRAEQGGRFTGVFNQPVEAGLAYLIGLVAAMWLLTQLERGSRARYATLALLASTTVGGLVSGSRLFVFGFIPLCISWFALRRRSRDEPSVAWRGWLALTLGGAVLLRLAPERSRERLFGSLLGGVVSNASSTLTGSRYDPGSSLSSTFDRAQTAGGLLGPGLNARVGAIDNAALGAYIAAGWFGVACVALMLLILAKPAYSAFRRSTPDNRRLLGCLCLVMLITSVGTLPLLLNRSATLWILLFVASDSTLTKGGGHAQQR